ncbi:hypothetical protein D9M68_981830 [compost metagenome]
MQAEIGLVGESAEFGREAAPMRAIGHRPGRAELATFEKVEDGAADAVRQGEIIGAQDEALRHRAYRPSLTGLAL